MDQPIKKLTVKGFKSIRSLEDLELGDLTVLIGANGAGKSNLIAFFSLLREISDRHLQRAVEKAGGADKILFLGPKFTKGIDSEFSLGNNTCKLELIPTAANKLIVASERYKSPMQVYGQVVCKPEMAATGAKDEADFAWCPAVRSVLQELTTYHFHDTSPFAAVRRGCTVRDYERLRAGADNLAAFLLRLRDHARDYYDRIVATIRLVAPFFDDLLLRPETIGNGDTEVLLEWTEKGGDYPFHPSQLSDGTLRFICLATALLQPNPPSTMLFDEPELGMHPYALEILSGLIHQAASRSQVIVSTQSASLLDRFEPEQVVVVEREGAESVFRRLDREQLKEWLEEYTLGELWEKNVTGGGPS